MEAVVSGKSAIILRPEHRDELFEVIPEVSTMPVKDMLIFTLSFFQALRVCEIAQLTVDAMLGPRGDILDHLHIAPHMTKGSRGRVIPLHPITKERLADFLDVYDVPWIAISPRDGGQMRADALARSIERTYDRAGLPGCRSHTGRATCITEMARRANLEGCTLQEVQYFAGHKRLETTASYLGPTGCLANLVASMGSDHSTGRRMKDEEQQGPIYWRKPNRVRRDGDVRGTFVGTSSLLDGDRHGRRDAERLDRVRPAQRRPRRHRPARRSR
jgi:integrase/recombinase XerD